MNSNKYVMSKRWFFSVYIQKLYMYPDWLSHNTKNFIPQRFFLVNMYCFYDKCPFKINNDWST